ncbi:MAG: DUF1343 domain-containing protein [Fibrobacteraceae bacterium]|nr:DUF1343 domain-containing protein [Fibrobacteraceae bacterium]
MTVKLALSRFEDNYPRELLGVRLGALLHPASVDSALHHTLETLLRYNGKLFKLAALFGPQHGIKGHTQDNMIEWEGGLDPELGIPVYSLYGKNREPSSEMLSHIDALFVDMQDVGARYYTFIWTLFLCMKACEKRNIPVIVLDRPNPLGNAVEGPALDVEYSSFVGLWKLPVRHGKTIGGLARQFKAECFPECSLYVMEMDGYDPKMWFDETGLPWVMPSPNMPTLDTAIVYPGMCLLEATNVSEGRGTTRPFEIFGAPFINAQELCKYMNGLNLPGVYFRENYFQPTFHKGAGHVCCGAQIHVMDRNSFRSFEMAVQLLRYLFHRYPEDFMWKSPPYEYEYEKLPIDILLGSGSYRKEFIENGAL